MVQGGARTGAAEAAERQQHMLATSLGPAISAALADPGVVEVLLNPDGRLWVDTLTKGRFPTGDTLSAADAERVIRLLASFGRTEVDRRMPILSAELPGSGERFEGLLPPVVSAPAFAIRKRASLVYGLDRYVADGIMTETHAAYLAEAVFQRLNIIIAGGTSTGKTTLANALLAEMAHAGDRVVILEDTIELQCAAQDSVALRTKPGVATMSDLVRSTMRLRPDRIVVGEVRGPEALDLLKAWGTGHPGGIATLHAGSARGALLRLEQLIQEAVVQVPRALIAETANVVVLIAGRGRQRRVTEVVRVAGLDAGGYQLHPIFAHPTETP